MARESLLATAWRTNKVWPIFLVGVLIVNLAGYLWLSQVTAPHVEDLERQLMESQARARGLKQQGTDTTTPRNIYAQGEKDLETFREAIPEKKDFSELIGDVFALAGRAGLEIDQISYTPKELKEEQLLLYSLSFTVAGSYTQIKKFIFSLEHSPRLIVIDEISFSGARDKDKEGVKMQIRLSTYFRSEIS